MLVPRRRSQYGVHASVTPPGLGIEPSPGRGVLVAPACATIEVVEAPPFGDLVWCETFGTLLPLIWVEVRFSRVGWPSKPADLSWAPACSHKVQSPAHRLMPPSTPSTWPVTQVTLGSASATIH
jgi:hypothetical protein